MADRKRTDFIVVHVTATPAKMDIGAKEVDRWHRQKGWSGIGYHYVIRRDGTVEPGRALMAIGAHVKGYNSRSIGISMVGGLTPGGQPEDNATRAQYASLEKLVRELTQTFPEAKVCGHRDLSPDRDGDGIIEPHEHLKACPNFDAIPWAKALGLPFANIRGVWDTSAPKPKPNEDEMRNAYLQRLLVRAGYQLGPVDGIVGAKTSAAIMQYQNMSGLYQSGTFDLRTVAHLRARFEQVAA